MNIAATNAHGRGLPPDDRERIPNGKIMSHEMKYGPALPGERKTPSDAVSFYSEPVLRIVGIHGSSGNIIERDVR